MKISGKSDENIIEKFNNDNRINFAINWKKNMRKLYNKKY